MRRRELLAGAAAALPADGLYRTKPERYWLRIRKEQFLLPESRTFLNNGSLGVAPRPVVDAVGSYLENSAALTVPEYEYPRWGYETLEAHRAEASAFLGCRTEDLAFTHNATEAISLIANGLDLKAGDEVLMTDQEHPSGRAGWLLKQARYGTTVREVAIPLPPPPSGDLADRIVSAIGARTRVLFFSGITTTTGLILPMRDICAAARAKGVLSVIDGAHVNGQIPVRLDDIGCDYYAGSPHKWMFAPAGCGILHGRAEALDRLWPAVVTGGWDDKKRFAARFMSVGTNNRAVLEGMIAGLRFGSSIGWARIYERIHELARDVRRRAAAAGYLTLQTPDNDAQYGSLVSFDIPEKVHGPFLEECKRRKIWVLRGKRMRVSAHIHTRPRDIDFFFETLDEVRRRAGA